MSLREEFLLRSGGNVEDAAAALAKGLAAGNPEAIKAGYSWPNAALAAHEQFPEVPVDRIYERNGWY